MKDLPRAVLNIERRNPAWVRDELILALDFYMRFRDRLPNKASEEIANLSADINLLGRELGLAGGATFRNPNGVYMKLMNFRRFDPQYTKSGRVGLQRGGKSDEIVWSEFTTDPDRLARVADAIRSGLSGGETLRGEDAPDLDIAEAEEGRLLTLSLLFIPSALATEGFCKSLPYAYALFALTNIGREFKDFCGGWN